MTKYIEPKIAELVAAATGAAGFKEMSAEEIRNFIRTNKIRSFKKLDEANAVRIAAMEAMQQIEARKTKKTPTQRKLRGYSFGKVWNAAVLAGDKLATHPCNFSKLKAQAESFGINAALYEQAELAEKVAAHLHYASI